MGAFFQQIFNLLTTEAGSLTYHLVLAFSIAAALQASFGYWRRSEFPQGRRMVAGLGVLLLLRLVLFAASGLAWQGLISAGLVLPPLDRAVTLLSLIVIIWLWAFPQPQRSADAATLLMGLLTLTLVAFFVVWGAGQSELPAFNGSWPDTVSEIYAMTLIALGVLVLFVRRPDGWSFGVSMFVLLFAGHLIYLLYFSSTGDYPGPVRLAQMAAYPMLLILPQRFLIQAVVAPEYETTPQTSTVSSVGMKILPTCLDMVTETDSDRICRAITSAVARAMRADLCLLVSLSTREHQVDIQCGFDLIREMPLQGASLENADLPNLSTALRRRRTLHLSSQEESPDLNSLANLFNLGNAGDLIAAPIAPLDGDFHFGVILLSPYSEHVWTLEEQSDLLDISEGLIRLIQRNIQISEIKRELDRLRASSQGMQAQVEQDRDELAAEFDQLKQTSEQDRSQLSSLAAVVAAHEALQDTVENLRAENETLQHKLELSSSGSASEEVQHLEEELRLTLEEVAYLRQNLSEMDEKMMALKSVGASGQPPSAAKMEQVALLAQELRQPMSSIIGYTDFLLGESIGILGTLQQKFLDRVKVATERMARLVDELIQVTTQETGPAVARTQTVDLGLVLDKAIAEASSHLREKDIALRVDMPEDLPHLDADPDAIEQVIADLLQNAGTVTPENGDIWLRARIESSDGLPDYVLLQVTDQGGGIAAADIHRVFSTVQRVESPAIEGVGESVDVLANVKALVEALGGRIWVDSELGQGSTFSVLFPVAATNPGPDGHGEKAA
ncbi:MAG: ATP-binding protein [Anaerolineales bacterium]|jgi:signal transduction histidine kinase